MRAIGKGGAAARIFCGLMNLPPPPAKVPLRMDFTEINSRGKRIDRQNSRFRTAKTIIIKFGLHASFVESESAKNALNETTFSPSRSMAKTVHSSTLFLVYRALCVKPPSALCAKPLQEVERLAMFGRNLSQH
ncbi:hypothetical protein TNCV_4084151 [Trichonephila clavipes]|nr:hypothetical protein TNCV_4084151 [Trichonephila clavipes]